MGAEGALQLALRTCRAPSPPRCQGHVDLTLHQGNVREQVLFHPGFQRRNLRPRRASDFPTLQAWRLLGHTVRGGEGWERLKPLPQLWLPGTQEGCRGLVPRLSRGRKGARAREARLESRGVGTYLS